MIDLYSWATPNGHKIHIMLEECGLPYQVHPINIGAGDQFSAAFSSISPNNKIPAIVDAEGPDGQPMALFESGAILLYLASKTGKFIGQNDRDKFNTLQWLMFQMGGVGPMLGQAHHFREYAPQKIEYAIERYTKEAQRIYGVINQRLSHSAFLAGDEYSIADIATYPWLRSSARQGINWDDFPHARRWYEHIDARPAVQRGCAMLEQMRKPVLDEKERQILFGNLSSSTK